MATIDYKEKYEQAMERARQFIEKPYLEDSAGIVRHIFPELAESEDEKMVKFIQIQLFNIKKTITENYELDAKLTKAIDWLEKQGKHSNFLSKIQVGDKVTRNEDGVLVNLSQLKRVAKPAEEYNITGIGSKNAQGKLGEMIKKLKPVNEVLEQNPADKVEPKFKVGDWVVSPNGVYWHIDAIDNNRYEVTANTGESSDWPLDTNIYHRFTIQDTNVGDALEFGDHGRLVVGIVSYVNKTTGKVDVSCLLENNNFKMGNYYNLDTIKPHPATKEQRDTLEKAMADAGYTFDFEKKELKKIEQKPAWSEEDEENRKNILYILNQLKGTAIYKEDKTAENCIDWLKSIKERYTWKPSDEQMATLKYYMHALIATKHKEILFGLYNDLKQL